MSKFVTSLLLALAGGIIGGGSSLVTMWTQSRTAERVRHEQFAREDRFRLFEKRLESYSALYICIGHARRLLTLFSQTPDSEERLQSARRARNEYWAAYTVVRLIGSDEISQVASELLDFIDRSRETATFDEGEFGRLLNVFIKAVRRELIGTSSGVHI